MMAVTQLNIKQVAIEIALALLCGFILGLERQVRGKPVGMRTSMLIALGTVAYIQVCEAITTSATDPTRVIGQIITGVGFLGAGVIMGRDGSIIGMTSGAMVWTLASIGCAIGFHQYVLGIAVTLTALLVLIGVRGLETLSKKLTRGVHKDVKGEYFEEEPSKEYF